MPALVTLVTLLTFVTPFAARAEIPEPDNVIYGLITLGATPVTALQSNVVVEARKTASGAIVASYAMGGDAAFGNFYSLRLGLEAFNPLTDTNASRVGGLIHLSVRDDSGVRDSRTISIAQRGQLVRVDFVELDSDGDGLPDRWEQQYFGGTTGTNPNADPDGDGRNNLREYLEHSNPLLADGRHPADNSPSDNQLTFDEVDAYATAWLNGDTSTFAPTNIPIAYVTRAAALAMGGEHYVFTNSPPTNAPMFWVNVPPLPTGPTGTNQIINVGLPGSVPVNRPLTVSLRARPKLSALAYAVQDAPPANWTVQSISHGGSYDVVNKLIKWGPFYDAGERDLSYEVVPPITATGSASFSGLGSFDGLNVVVPGNRTVNVTAGANPIWNLATSDATGPLFRLFGRPSTAYVIETSTNLLNWQSLQTITTTANGTYSFRPPNPSQSRHRYFRARTAL